MPPKNPLLVLTFSHKKFPIIYFLGQYSFYGIKKPDGNLYGLHYCKDQNAYFFERKKDGITQVCEKLTPSEVNVLPEQLKEALYLVAKTRKSMETPKF